MALWEVCSVMMGRWVHDKQRDRDGDRLIDKKPVVRYYTPKGVFIKFPALNSWEQTPAILSVAEWELVTVQHSLSSDNTKLMGLPYLQHPSGDVQWREDWPDMVAYLKRPIQAQRKIDDAL